MKHPSIKNKSEQDAFTDLLFNALLGFALMFAVAFMLMSTPEKKGKIETKAEYLITVRWEDKHPDDVDAIVEDPSGGLVWYHNRDSGLMHLDRDDRGVFADQIEVAGVKVNNPINQETVTLERPKPASMLSIYCIIRVTTRRLPVSVKVEKLNPEVSVIYYGNHELNGSGDELTAIRFTLDASGYVERTSQRPKRLLTRAVAEAKNEHRIDWIGLSLLSYNGPFTRTLSLRSIISRSQNFCRDICYQSLFCYLARLSR